jgi:hypothetical protein
MPRSEKQPAPYTANAIRNSAGRELRIATRIPPTAGVF